MDWIKQLIGGWGEKRKFSLAATVDHVELSSTHLVMGIKIGWRNETNEPIPVKEIKVKLHLGGRREEPLRLYPLERFERVWTHMAIQKMPVEPFTLPPHEIHTEQLRFISQEILDIPPGGYAVDVELTDDANNIIANRIKIRVDAKAKYRHSDEWQEG